MTEPQFDPSGTVAGLYWLAGSGRRAGFRASGQTAPGAGISLTQGWADARGLWFWLDAAPASDKAFAAALSSWLGLLPPVRGPRALWIAGADGDIAEWRCDMVDMTRSGDSTTVGRGAIFETGSVRVMVGAGNAVSAGQYTNDFQGWGLILNGSPGLVFATSDGLLPAARGFCGISYGPGQAGCLVWKLDLPAPGNDTPSGLEQLGASLRFFSPSPAGDGAIRPLVAKALRQKAAAALYNAFDPLAPLDPARTRFALLPFNATLSQVPVFATGYVSARGYGISLSPRNVASALPPGFVLGIQPLVAGAADDAPGDVPTIHYLTPDGDFDLASDDTNGTLPTAAPHAVSVGAAPAERLLCGISGLDYVGLPAATGTVLHFHAGRAAYAPPTVDPTTGSLRAARDGEAAPPALTTLGTTSWVWLTAGSAPRYYAQPEDAPFYTGAGFLDYLEISATSLTTATAVPAFPMVGYAGLDGKQADAARELEARGIAPERRRQIGLLTSGQRQAVSCPAPTDTPAVPAVSPPGLALGYAGDDAPWAWLAIGNTGSATDGLPDLRFTAVDGALRQAMLSNRLFMVLGHPGAVLSSASVEYRLTPDSLGLIHALPPDKGVPDGVYEHVAAAVAAAGYAVYRTETDFNAMLRQADSAITPGQMEVFQRFAGMLSPSIGEWLFRLSPRNWEAPDRTGPKNTRLVFKFVGGRTLADLVADTSAWAWAEAASEDGKAASARDEILAIIQSARDAAAAAHRQQQASPYDHFLKMVDDPQWRGVLALSVEVPLDRLPAPLQPLAAGIDANSFYAHHLGLTATSFTEGESGAPRFDVTSSFGLIDYQNPSDQYFSKDIAFAFKVQQLTVGFENGKLSSFTSRAQLMVNRMFGADTRLFPTEHGNNIILDGVYQTERNDDGGGERGTYVFAMRQAGAFQLALSQLAEVGVDAARLVTVRAADPAGGNTTVTAAFQLSGRLRFGEPAQFDPFCWGPPAAPAVATGRLARPGDGAPQAAPGSDGLAYSNYAITMRFSLSAPGNVTFRVAEEAIALDPANSRARDASLFARFPLRLVGLRATVDPKLDSSAPAAGTPEDAGFVSVSAPLQQGKLTQPWYGLVYEVDLGTLGALAGSVGITVRLLAGWSPGSRNTGGKDQPDRIAALYFGVALPGVENMLGVSLPLQGILDIGFRTIQFSTYMDNKQRRQYLMRLRDFGLHVLGLSFPPGHNDVTLFGNPDQSSNTKLGWYAAYDNGAENKRQVPRGVARQAVSPPALHSAIQRVRRARPHGPVPALAPASPENGPGAPPANEENS